MVVYSALSVLISSISVAIATQSPLQLGACVPRTSHSHTHGAVCSWQDELAVSPDEAWAAGSNFTLKTASADGEDSPFDYPPFCVEAHDEQESMCLFTSLKFAGGRGISIVSAPSEMEKILQLDAFTDSSAHMDVNSNTPPPFETRALPGRGIGVIANKTLQRGDLIFSHTPVLVVSEQALVRIGEQDVMLLQNGGVARLPNETQQKFLALHGHFGGDPVNDITNTNSFSVEFSNTKDEYYAVLPETARMNHDCAPNAHYYLDPKTLAHHVHALRTIHPGEEITISYLDNTMTRQGRMQKLKMTWGFDCNCSRCTQPRVFTDASDKRLELIASVTERLAVRNGNRTANRDGPELLISLYKQERLDGPITEAYTYAALEENFMGRKEAAIQYAMLAVESGLLYSGPHDDDVIQMHFLMEHPEEHWSWKHLDKVRAESEATTTEDDE